MEKKKPMIKETVGALYVAFNTPKEDGTFNPEEYEETIKSEVVKKVGTTENGDSTTVRASGTDYETVNNTSSVDLAVELIAFAPKDMARMRGEKVLDNGLVESGDGERPYFAYGKVVKKVGGGYRYDWYPKCQLLENTDDISTSEESFSEQTDTVTIRAYKFDGRNFKMYIDSEIKSFSGKLTEEKFFEKPILNAADLDAILTDMA